MTSNGFTRKQKRGTNQKLITMEGEVLVETDKAYLFAAEDWEVWLPKSQCTWNADDRIMAIPDWLARDKELI